jgi:hypothetical protein
MEQEEKNQKNPAGDRLYRGIIPDNKISQKSFDFSRFCTFRASRKSIRRSYPGSVKIK